MRGQARAEAAPWGAWGSPHVPEAALSLLPQAWATIYTLGSAGSLTRGRGTEPNLNLEAAKKGQAVTCPGPHGGALQLSPPQGGAGDQDPQGQPTGLRAAPIKEANSLPTDRLLCAPTTARGHLPQPTPAAQEDPHSPRPELSPQQESGTESRLGERRGHGQGHTARMQRSPSWDQLCLTVSPGEQRPCWGHPGSPGLAQPSMAYVRRSPGLPPELGRSGWLRGRRGPSGMGRQRGWGRKARAAIHQPPWKRRKRSKTERPRKCL